MKNALKFKTSIRIAGIVVFAALVLSGCTFAGTYTRNGNNAVLYRDGKKDATASVSGNTLSVISDGQKYTATKANTGSNPFAGTWKGTDKDGDSLEIVFGNKILMLYESDDKEDIDETNVGSYEFEGNAAELEIDDEYLEASISGNRMKIKDIDLSFSKVNTGSNPFAGTWRGSSDGIRFEIIMGENTWAIHFFE